MSSQDDCETTRAEQEPEHLDGSFAFCVGIAVFGLGGFTAAAIFAPDMLLNPLVWVLGAAALGCAVSETVRRGRVLPPPEIVGGRRMWEVQHAHQAAKWLDAPTDSLPPKPQHVPQSHVEACVNACEGLNPESVPDLVEALEQQVARNDEENWTCWCTSLLGPNLEEHECAQCLSRAALAKARRGDIAASNARQSERMRWMTRCEELGRPLGEWEQVRDEAGEGA